MRPGKTRRNICGRRSLTRHCSLADADELVNYLMGAHCAVYRQWRELTYYLTDANDIYWRAQDTNELNDKGHFPDCSEFVASVRGISLTYRSCV